MKFHDGHELTSKDVVYTFGSFLDPDFVSAKKAAFRMLESVKALDKYTVEFRLKEPFGSFPTQLVLHVVPDGAGDSLRTFPIGTGPYRFVRYVPDEQVDLTAYEGYWDGLPQNAGVMLRIIPDETMRGLELRKGTADLTVNDVSPDIAFQLQKDNLKIAQAPGVDYTYIGLNMRDPVLRDKRVRHAHRSTPSIARPSWRTCAAGSHALPSASCHRSRGRSSRTSSSSHTTWNGRSSSSMKPATLTRMAMVRCPRLRLSLKTSTDDFFRLQATVIQQNLRLVGIDVDVRSYEFATFYADVLCRQRPDVHAAVGGRDRSGHAAPPLPLGAGAAERLQPHLLQQSGGRSI